MADSDFIFSFFFYFLFSFITRPLDVTHIVVGDEQKYGLNPELATWASSHPRLL